MITLCQLNELPERLLIVRCFQSKTAYFLAKKLSSLSFYSGYQLHAPLNNFFSHNSKVKFRWTSIKCFHDDTPVLLTAVEFVMETFD